MATTWIPRRTASSRSSASAAGQNRPELARRFVFITGTSEHTDYAGLIVDLAVPILTKPFDMAALQRVTRETLATAVS